MPFPPIRSLRRLNSLAPPDRLLFERLDVLIVMELGQNHSPSGLDPDVIGRLYVETQPEPTRPVITRLAVLDLSAESRGDANGLGFADLTTAQLVSRIDRTQTRERALASGLLERARTPLTLPTDEAVIQAAVETCWRVGSAEVRLVLIPNTRELGRLWISEALWAESQHLIGWELGKTPRAIPFDADGTCDRATLFPDARQSAGPGGDS